jgi:hypothetical protein
VEHDRFEQALATSAAGRGSWDVWEVLGVSLLLATVLLAVGDTAAGLLTAGASSVANQNEVTLLYATQWASPYLALFPLAALGATWWRIRAWARPVAAPGQGITPLRRSRGVASGTVAVLVLIALAAIGAAVSTLLLIHASDAPGNQVWPSGAETLAESSAALALCGTGIGIAIGLLRQVSGRSNPSHEADAEEELPDAEEELPDAEEDVVPAPA